MGIFQIFTSFPSFFSREMHGTRLMKMFPYFAEFEHFSANRSTVVSFFLFLGGRFCIEGYKMNEEISRVASLYLHDGNKNDVIENVSEKSARESKIQ